MLVQQLVTFRHFVNKRDVLSNKNLSNRAHKVAIIFTCQIFTTGNGAWMTRKEYRKLNDKRKELKNGEKKWSRGRKLMVKTEKCFARL